MKPEKTNTLSRVFALLEYIAHSGRAVSFTEILDNIPSIGRTSLSRLLSSLLAESLIRKRSSDGYYELSTRIMDLGHQLVSQDWLKSKVVPSVKALSLKLEHSISYWEDSGETVKLLVKEEVDSSAVVRPPEGGVRNFHFHTAGKMVLAYREKASVVSYLSGISPNEPELSYSNYDDVLAVREKGSIVDVYSPRNITRIAVPVAKKAYLKGVLLCSMAGIGYSPAVIDKAVSHLKTEAERLSAGL